MNDCHICYNKHFADDEFIFLECLHGLCKGCFNLLQKNNCPFCRKIISKGVKNVVIKRQNVYCIYDRPIKVRVRRRRRKTKTTYETINTDNGRIIVETSKKDKKYKKIKLDNKKRGKWARSMAQQRICR